MVEVAVEVGLDEFQLAAVEEGVGFEDGAPACAGGRAVLVADEVVELVLARYVVGLHADADSVGHVAVVVVVHANHLACVMQGEVVEQHLLAMLGHVARLLVNQFAHVLSN